MKSLIVIFPAVSCAGFVKRGAPDLSTDLARSATMHEIPNLPFPSLHVPEQTTPQHTGADKPEPQEAADSRKADSEE
ncbi:hypothetical protein SAMN04490196_2925 [Pseudomonas moraviensis]|nr:hypothetical protein SAMN04490196_2925 [Pseudomonas moraviensis]